MQIRYMVLLTALAVALYGGLQFSHAEAGGQETESYQAGQMTSTRQRGRALRTGDCIGVVAPASGMDMGNARAFTQYFAKHGYKLKFAPSCMQDYGGFAGTDFQRAADLMAFFEDEEVQAILCLRGGYGSARILDKLDYEKIASHPKMLIGFSDITALHAALGERSRLATVHGPMLSTFKEVRDISPYTEEQFFAGLSSAGPMGEVKLPEGRKLATVVPGRAEGIIVGGNLTVLASLTGTPYELQGDGALLLLEDTGEAAYRLDRMLQQLWQSGLLSRVSGIIYGDFLDGDTELNQGEFNTEEILAYYARLSGKPTLKGLPAGHDDDNLFLPFGIRAVLEAKEDGTASLRLEEAAAVSGQGSSTRADVLPMAKNE